MTTNEKEVLERFLQYGDLFEKSNLIFMGLEEGTAQAGQHLAIPARMALFNQAAYAPYREFVNKLSFDDGWFISDGRSLGQALGGNFHAPNKNDFTMRCLARFHWLMKNNNRTTNYASIGDKNFTTYSNFNRMGTHSHMIDWYPFPKKGVGVAWPKDYQTIVDENGNQVARFPTAIDYYTYYDNPGNTRINIFTKLFNKFRMDVTISYVGIEQGNFKKEDFYLGLGFKFRTITTANVDPRSAAFIKPSPNPKLFKLGDRISPEGKKQIVALTPFLGRWTITNADIDVIASWLP